MTLGKYSASLAAFAKGTFGQAASGIAPDGTGVAVKRFINPKKVDLESHQEMMAHIRKHVML